MTSPTNPPPTASTPARRPAQKAEELFNKKWLRERRFWLLLGIVFLLIAIAGFLCEWAGTVVFLIPAVSALATAWLADFRKHMGPEEFFLAASLIVLLFLILVIAALWLSVRLFRTVDESRRVTTSGSVASVPRAALEFSVPTRIPAGDQPVTLTITSLLSVLPLNIDVKLPHELRFHPGDQSGRKRSVTLSPGDVVGLPVVNSRQNLISSSPAITLTVSGEQYDPLPIEVEGVWAGALRGFMDRVEAQPGLLLSLVGGGLLAQLFQWLQYRYQREQKQREETKEAEKKLEKALEQGRIDEAGRALDVWETLAPPGDAPAVVAATRRLLRVARAEVESGEDLLETMQLYAEQWPDACGRALQMGYGSLSARMDMATLRIARSYIQPKDPELIRWQEDLKAREDKRGGIAHDWLSPSLESEPLTADRDSAATTGSLADLRNYWRASAEDDRRHLFHRSSKNAFWRGHPLSRQLRETRDPRLVYGARGSGRTALALSLALYPSLGTKPFLGLYSTDSSGLPEIRRGFAQKLLLFVEKYRREVAALSAEDRKLLAHCLGTYLGWDLAASEVERIRKDESDLKGFDEIGRDFWRRRIGAAFGHLLKALDRSRASPSTPAWPRDLCVCAQSLQLNRVLLVVDVNDDGSPQLRNEILPRLTNWAEDGLTTLIFLPDAESKTRVAARSVPVETLKWDMDQLLDMLEHRHRSGFPVRPTDALLAQLLKKCVNGECTPRVLRELCVGGTERQ